MKINFIFLLIKTAEIANNGIRYKARIYKLKSKNSKNR
jgi:hypothetical protein